MRIFVYDGEETALSDAREREEEERKEILQSEYPELPNVHYADTLNNRNNRHTMAPTPLPSSCSHYCLQSALHLARHAADTIASCYYLVPAQRCTRRHLWSTVYSHTENRSIQAGNTAASMSAAKCPRLFPLPIVADLCYSG